MRGGASGAVSFWIEDSRGEFDDWVERKGDKWELEEGESIMTVIRWGGEECK